MGLFIVINGLDGAGKSSLVEFLKIKLETPQKMPKYFYTRIGFTPRMKILKFYTGIKTKKHRASQTKQSTRKRNSKSLIRDLYRIISLMDFALILIEIRWSLLFGNRIITDRYIEDNRIIDQETHGQHKGIFIFLWKMVGMLAQKPDINIFLSIPAKEAFRRIMIRSNNEIEQSLETLETRAEMYRNTSEYENWFVVDTTQPLEKNQDIVWAKLNELL